MTLADGIILVVLVIIVGGILYSKLKNRKQTSCSACAYAVKKARK